MIEIIKKYIAEYQLIPDNVKLVYAAVSGGVDSCVMLDILHKLQNDFGYKLVVLHYNHNTRGKNSHQDEKFVEELAKKYGLKIRIGRLRHSARSRSETYLREQRLSFFNKILSQSDSCRLATGHNRNDNVETFLMRLAKGSRLKGLLAIRPVRAFYIRPLLNITRADILYYAKEINIIYREDKTNLNTKILRNKIRHEIIPYLEKSFNVNLLDNLSKVILDFYRYNELYENKLLEAVHNITKMSKSGISLQRKRYFMYNETIRRGLLEYCISRVYPLNYTVSDRNLKIWDSFISDAQTGKKLSFLDTGVALAERANIIFGEISEEKEESFRLSLGKSLMLRDRYEISFQNMGSKDYQFTNEKNIEFIDGGKSGKKLIVRFWKKGDSFRPLGMKNSRKLSDFFIDLKISTILKKEIPLICKGDQILWIAGQRLDDQYKISDTTKIVYKLELSEIKNNDKNRTN